MWTSEIIRARPANERGEYSIAVTPDGTRHMCWSDGTYTYWRIMYSSKPLNGAWSTPTVAVQGELYGHGVNKYFTCFNCKMDVNDAGTPIFIYYANVEGYGDSRPGGANWWRVNEVRLQTGILGSYTVLYHWDNEATGVGGGGGAHRGEAISAKRGDLNYWYTVVGNPATGNDELYENGSKVYDWSGSPSSGEVCCDNGPGGYTSMYRDGGTWTTNFGALSGLYYAGCTMTEDGKTHVGGMAASWYPTYKLYSGGALVSTTTLESADIANWVHVQTDADGNAWVVWADYNSDIPHCVNVTADTGTIYEYDGALDISADSDSWGAGARLALTTFWGGLNSTSANQVWIEFRPDHFSDWHIF